jgi:HlyD family secretion protein
VISVAIGAGIVLGVGALMAFSGKPSAPQPAKGAVSSRQSVDVFTATLLNFDVTTTATGELRTRNQIELRNRIDSDTTIIDIIPEGRRVRAGEVLVKLNAEPMVERLDEESLAIESARAALVEAEEGYAIQVSENESSVRAANLKLALANLDLEKWRSGEVKSKRLELQHSLERATKEEVRLREKLEKSRSLQERGYYSLDLLKQDELAWEQSKADLLKHQLSQEVYEEFEYTRDERQKLSDVEEAKAEVERVHRQNASRLASKEADRNNKRQALAIREQKLAKLREQLAAATVTAPSDGLVVYGSSIEQSRWGNDDGPMQVGSRVYPNQLLIVLPDTSEMIAAVKVHESLAGRIKPGQQVNIKVDAVSDLRFFGRVESIGVLAEQTSRWMDPNLREYTVRIALDRESVSDGRSELLKPSMRCEAEIILGNVAEALVVPVQAVFNEGPVRFVHVQQTGQGSNSRYIRRPVLLGQRSDRYAEIRAGLKEGERVLVRRPEPGEVLAGAWQQAELTAAGLKFTDDGQIVPANWTPDSDGRAGRPRGPGDPGDRRPTARPGARPDDIDPPADSGEAADDAASTEPATAEPAETSAKAEPAAAATPSETPAQAPASK